MERQGRRRSWRSALVLTAGLIAPLAVAAPAPAAAQAPKIYTVTNTSGSASVPGSLPWAVFHANYSTPGFDRIRFDIPGPGPHEIKVSQTLYINDQVDIDARTQPGTGSAPRIWVTGGSGVASLFLFQSDPSKGTTSSGSSLQGFGLYGYTANAVTIMPTSLGNWIQHNWMGFRPTSSGVLRNVQSGLPGANISRGIGIASSYNVVRGNVISGVDNGVVIGLDSQAGAPYRTNSIRENMIGTDPTGTTTAGYGNIGDGIFLGAGAQENWLGPNNVLSGNASAGVELLHPTNRGNVVFRNKIGLDVTGTKRLGNGELGVLFANGAWFNAIGGPFGGNHIAGNRLGGIAIGTAGWGAANTIWVQYNVIGLDVNGRAVGGQQVGISVNSGSQKIVIEENVIGGHDQHGVIVGDTRVSSTTGNSVRANHIGVDKKGVHRPNQGFGVMFLNAGWNWVTANNFGANVLGPIGADRSPGLVVS